MFMSSIKLMTADVVNSIVFTVTSNQSRTEWFNEQLVCEYRDVYVLRTVSFSDIAVPAHAAEIQRNILCVPNAYRDYNKYYHQTNI